MHDTEDKKWWVNEWRLKEDEFVDKICPKLGLHGSINPEKRYDKYAADLVVNGTISDLKCQTTPFFKAKQLYNIPPRYAITFNEKDYKRYKSKYPDIVIYFWVHWLEREKKFGNTTYTVEPLFAVYRFTSATINQLIEQKNTKRHEYIRRKDDKAGNAKASFLFDIRKFECLFHNEDGLPI